jgi:hypothetical protein
MKNKLIPSCGDDIPLCIFYFNDETKSLSFKGSAKAVTHPRKATICNSLFQRARWKFPIERLSSHLLHHQPVKRALKAIFLGCLPLWGSLSVRSQHRAHTLNLRVAPIASQIYFHGWLN